MTNFKDEALRKRFTVIAETAYSRADPAAIVPWTDHHNDGPLTGRDLSFNAGTKYTVDLQIVTCPGWKYPRVSQVATRVSDDAEMDLVAYGDGRLLFEDQTGEVGTPEKAVDELEKFVSKIKVGA